jgi:small-conductance mechanosensitive channel
MSILGWTVMIVGGSVHVGDRIRVTIEGETYVGDVVDISLLRITLYEDVTLTSVMSHKRAGRVVFVPNNYIFTHLLANYSHNGIKTVWDEVEIMITFESNHKKALHIVKEIAKKYSKGYGDIARHSLTDLRDKYSLRTINVEPRAFTFIKEYGIVVSVWFQTNSYATLTLKSSISAEIVDLFLAEDDITIAYPTQRIDLKERLTND